MTAILTELRNLDARRDRGELSPGEYESARAAILRGVEDAQTHFVETTPRPAPRTAKKGSSALGISLVICLAVMGLCISLTLLFLPNMNLALTLGVTILAALSVGLLQEKGE